MAARLATTEQVRRQLVADLAHELRNPIASLRATAEAAADGVLPAGAATWATLLEQTGRLERLAEDVTALSQTDERQLRLHRSPMQATDLARDAAAAAQAGFDAAQVTLTCEAEPGPYLVDVDPDRMGEVLANLLSNAYRHTGAGDTVTVSVQRQGRTVQIAVRDSGDGFPTSDTEKLFERFYRGDHSRRRDNAGSGIGLTLARAVTIAHGGEVTAHSDGPGKGAMFTVSLPAAQGS
jgi:signal transduction histidine kinase